MIRQVRVGPGIDVFPTPVREAPQTAFREPLWPGLGASGTESRIFRVPGGGVREVPFFGFFHLRGPRGSQEAPGGVTEPPGPPFWCFWLPFLTISG